ncbi:LysR substrate-binding domain-containing protein [Bacillus manliponensis]|uniref:LysR family transcriptional regulator n=1 Tax=Bacillus manliponensis TaxID=574376 RepID=UPI0035198C4B
MSIIKYEVFEEVIKTGSFTKAAEKLNMTQSAVSRAIASLEKELGITLFIREPRSIQLTKSGAEAYEYIYEILVLNRKLLNIDFTNPSNLPTTIKVGAFASISKHLLPKVIQQFNALYPFLKIVVFEGTYDEIDAWVIEGVIDIGFTVNEHPTFICKPFLQDELMVATSNQMEAEFNASSLNQFFETNKIIMPTAPYRKQIESFFHTNKINYHVHSYISDCNTIGKMIDLQIGISIGPKLFLQSFDDIKLHSLPGKHYRQVYITQQPRAQDNQYILKFVEMAQEYI